MKEIFPREEPTVQAGSLTTFPTGWMHLNLRCTRAIPSGEYSIGANVGNGDELLFEGTLGSWDVLSVDVPVGLCDGEGAPLEA